MSDISSYDRWHRSAFNLCRVIVVHDGPDFAGHTYVDGRHEHEICICDTPEEALWIVNEHNHKEPA